MKIEGLINEGYSEEVEGYPPILGLSGSLSATLMYMRQNIVQAVIGEILGVSQPTVSRAIKALTEAISRTPAVLLLTAKEVPEGCDYVVDGTLLPCPDWRDRRDLWSVKHGRAGMNDPDPGPVRRRIRVGLRPLSGIHARRGRPGRLRTARGNRPLRMDRRQGVRGKGNDHPAQETPNGELSETAKEENKSVNKIRRDERAHHRLHQILENPPHTLPSTPGNIRADHHRSTRTPCLQNHPRITFMVLL